MWDEAVALAEYRPHPRLPDTNNIGETELLILYIYSHIDSTVFISFHSLWVIYSEPKGIIYVKAVLNCLVISQNYLN